MIRVSEVHIPEEAEELVLGVLRSGMLAQGPMVRRLEEGFEALTGARHAVACSNGTTALELAIEAAGVAPGDEVLTSPFTFVATVNAALAAGATVRFVDISLDDFTIDVDQLADRLTPATRAVIPVHLYGQAARMDEIAKLAASEDVAIIEDAAQAHGANLGGRGVGTWGVGCFSLYATKNMTTGEGGMVTTNDDEIADRLRILRNQGMRQRYQYEVVGHNHRMTDLAAAVGVAELGALNDRTELRIANAARLLDGLDGIDGLVLPTVRDGCRHVFHQFTIRVDDSARLTRDLLADGLREAGIDSGIYYPKAAYDYECYRRHPRVVVEAMPRAEQAASQVLSIPVHPFLSESDLDHIVSTIRTLLSSSS